MNVTLAYDDDDDAGKKAQKLHYTDTKDNDTIMTRHILGTCMYPGKTQSA